MTSTCTDIPKCHSALTWHCLARTCSKLISLVEILFPNVIMQLEIVFCLQQTRDFGSKTQTQNFGPSKLTINTINSSVQVDQIWWIDRSRIYTGLHKQFPATAAHATPAHRSSPVTGTYLLNRFRKQCPKFLIQINYSIWMYDDSFQIISNHLLWSLTAIQPANVWRHPHNGSSIDE